MGARYALRRVLGALPTLFSILVATFWLSHADPSASLAGEGASAQRVAEIRHSLGLDQSLPRQFATYLSHLAHGNLGYSISQSQPVRTVIAERIGPTLLLTGAALAIATVLGLIAGMVTARRPKGPVDVALNAGAVVSFAVPGFWLAQIAVIVFALHLGLLPLLGYVNARNPPTGWHRATDIAYHLILPAFVLATSEIALLSRVTRNGLVRELDQEYVLTARAKGVPEGVVVSHHAMRNVMLPITTVVGGRIGFLLSGSLVIETVFSWPGLGVVLTNAATSGDSPLVLGVVLVIAVGVLTANLITELLYAWIDPRVRTR